jgi:hypothetical protein
MQARVGFFRHLSLMITRSWQKSMMPQGALEQAAQAQAILLQSIRQDADFTRETA